MKLIRLISDKKEDDGILDNEFNQDIKIEENAQIAYRSMAVQLDPLNLVIDNSNNGITLQTKISDGTTSGTSNLPLGSFSSSNPDSLLSNLENTLNNSLVEKPVNIGTQFQALIKDGKTRIESKFCPNSNVLTKDNFKTPHGATLNNASVTTTQYSSSVSSVTDENIFYSFQEFGKGCSIFRARIRNLTDNGGASNTNGFDIGLSDINPTSWTVTGNFTLSDDQKTYNIKLQKPTDNYFFNVKGNANQDGAFAPENVLSATLATNDIIEFIKLGTNLILRVYRNSDATVKTLATVNLNTQYNGVGEFGVNQPLYPYIIFHGIKANSSLDSKYTRCLFDPFESNITPSSVTTNEEIAEGNDHEELGVKPSQARPGQKNTRGRLTFESSSIAKYLGFNNIVNDSETTNGNFTLHSDKNFQAGIKYDNLVLELMNLQVDSYDGLEKGRRNIIATIPAIKNTDDVIVNEASNLVFIDLDNAQPRNFRNIKARILYGDLTSVKTIGLTSVSLLIKNKNEK